MSGVTNRTVCCNEISTHNRLYSHERHSFAPLLSFKSQYFERNSYTFDQLGDVELEKEERRFGQIVSHVETHLFIPSHETEQLILEIRAAFDHAKQQRIEAFAHQFVGNILDQVCPKK